MPQPARFPGQSTVSTGYAQLPPCQPDPQVCTLYWLICEFVASLILRFVHFIDLFVRLLPVWSSGLYTSLTYLWGLSSKFLKQGIRVWNSTVVGFIILPCPTIPGKLSLAILPWVGAMSTDSGHGCRWLLLSVMTLSLELASSFKPMLTLTLFLNFKLGLDRPRNRRHPSL